ncbi:MAG: helix-turn-helix domain-containing protein [Rickettsiales bacterium]|jgi:transcriptional regulator with XRE-family HTH domain|nr:helix-turn-helix domain-containing protein [Rickettsiales bacterium]
MEEISFNKELGALIRATRLKRGMSQRNLAERIGITHQQFQKYEAGENNISAYKLHKISMILETSFDSYVFGDYPQSDYRVLDEAKIAMILLSIIANLQDLGTELLMQKNDAEASS